MAHLLSVDRSTSSTYESRRMVDEGLDETTHLESWIKQHPEVLGDDLLVVTTQFNSWASDHVVARERPDVLALASSGELVVIELKRQGDRRIHLQAITYGALVAGFTKEVLADAHAAWLRHERKESFTRGEALQRLEDHVESEWTDDLFRLPRLVLVAEEFPPQVLTTVQWLLTVAPDLIVECHEYQLFRQDDTLVVSFQRLFPVDDLEDRRLRPTAVSDTQVVREQIVSNTRRAKSVTIIHEHSLIPAGVRIELELEARVRPEVVQTVNEWMAGDPERSDVTWALDPSRPLRWAPRPGVLWTPSALRNEIFKMAGVEPPTFSAADAWSYEGRNLYTIATAIEPDE